MRTFELGEVLASRTLHFQPKAGDPVDVVVTLGTPVPDGRGWMCPFQIRGIGRELVIAIFGVDAMQALLLALHTLPTELRAIARKESGSFPDGNEDLGLTHACSTHLKYDVAR